MSGVSTTYEPHHSIFRMITVAILPLLLTPLLSPPKLTNTRTPGCLDSVWACALHFVGLHYQLTSFFLIALTGHLASNDITKSWRHSCGNYVLTTNINMNLGAAIFLPTSSQSSVLCRADALAMLANAKCGGERLSLADLGFFSPLASISLVQFRQVSRMHTITLKTC